jgi:hypothetical protein
MIASYDRVKSEILLDTGQIFQAITLHFIFCKGVTVILKKNIKKRMRLNVLVQKI